MSRHLCIGFRHQGHILVKVLFAFLIKKLLSILDKVRCRDAAVLGRLGDMLGIRVGSRTGPWLLHSFSLGNWTILI
jgi:hypothetical protein